MKTDLMKYNNFNTNASIKYTNYSQPEAAVNGKASLRSRMVREPLQGRRQAGGERGGAERRSSRKEEPKQGCPCPQQTSPVTLSITFTVKDTPLSQLRSTVLADLAGL